MRASALPLLLLLLLSASLIACPKKKTDGSDAAPDDAASEASAATDSGPAMPDATNVYEIARFGDETKIANETAKTEAPMTYARKSPPSGEVVASLPRGTEVVKMGAHSGQFLVTFANPKKADERLMGWISEAAFKAAAMAAQKCKADKECTAGFVCIPHETGTKCEKSCSGTNTAACPDHSDCKGNGPNAEGKIVQFCVSNLPPDAGAPKDGGGAAAVDAGKKPDGGR